jgi:AcrR family transcriptional regulator
MSRLQRRTNEMREKILVAAFDLFLAQGVATTTIEEICERADTYSLKTDPHNLGVALATCFSSEPGNPPSR